MDIVITYVDGLDPQWQESYEKHVGGSVNVKRFRDWGTLRYLLRGIEKYIPFTRNVYLVVSSESQIPDWVDRSVLKTVLHKDIIPEEYLPVFNSTAIEVFLPRIEGLDEQWVYFNDDLFPVAMWEESDFFEDGKAVLWHSHHRFASNLYMKQARNCDLLARRAAGKSLTEDRGFIRPQHACMPMLRSRCLELSELMKEDILKSVTRIRRPENLSQYIFPDYLYHKGLSVRRRISNKHFSLAVAPIRKICRFIARPSRKLVCINDVNLSEKKFKKYRRMLLEAFEARFPEKSSFEL